VPVKLDSRKFWLVVSLEGLFYSTAQTLQYVAVLWAGHQHAPLLLSGASAIYALMKDLGIAYLGVNVAQNIGNAVSAAIGNRRQGEE
jgi:hypothetical protein